MNLTDDQKKRMRADLPLCLRCGSALINGPDGWPTQNESGCRNQYHDGGYGSREAPGYCGVQKREWLK